MNLWEIGKQERRERILAAAGDLVRERGFEGLSMRDLAGRAGVSVATLYNLCGSKNDILLGLVDETLTELGQEVDRRADEDVLRQAQRIVESAVELFVARAELHRPLLRALLSGKSARGTALVVKRCIGRLRGCLERGVRDGLLERGLRTDLLAHQFLISFGAILDLWTQEVIDGRAFRLQSLHVLYLFLLAGATPPTRPRVKRAVKRWEKELGNTNGLWMAKEI